MRRLLALAAAVLLSAAASGEAAAQARCGLSLVLAIDVSSSVDEADYRLQMDGLAGALTDPSVMTAIIESGGIQAMAFEWSGRFSQVEVAPWAFLSGEASIRAFAGRISAHPRSRFDLPTALGHALGHAVTQFATAPLACARRVIDVSGDGVNNEGFGPMEAYRHFPVAGIQVNALVIAGADPDPVGYYRAEVLHGPGAFLEVAADFADYREAMRRKLLREINGSALSLAR